MVGASSWFHSLWRTPRKHETGPVIGVLAFEVAGLMSRLVHLWHSLNDKQIRRLREDIENSVGIERLVSKDENYIEGLVCAEFFENMGHVARAVAKLGIKCNDPGLKSFQPVFNDLIKIGFDPNGWEFSWKKMERKTKKMERLISLNANLYQEIEILNDLEHNLRRMRCNNDTDALSLVEVEKKVVWKQQEVNNLKEISLWNMTYDYTFRLLARSLFTIFGRIKHVFGISQTVQMGESKDSGVMNSDYNNHRNPSLSTLMKSSVHPSENGLTRFSSGPLVKSITRFGPISRTVKTNNFYSGPLGSSTKNLGPRSGTNRASNFFSGPLGSSTKNSGPMSGANRASNFFSGPLGSSTKNSGPMSGAHRAANFFSGPLGKPKTKSGAISGTSKTIWRLWQRRDNSNVVQGKNLHPKHDKLALVGSRPLKECITVRNSTSLSSNGVHSEIVGSSNSEELAHSDIRLANLSSIFSPKRRFLDAPADTLGGAALALHYANVIIVIEKLVASPHLIGHDARDDLYNMLPASVRAALSKKLKPYAKKLASSLYDTDLAGEWSEAMSEILEWLAPLAHNMIRWQSERSLEQQNFVSRTNVLLVQTLYFANQEKTEATITELLVGLNYIWRFGRELNANPLLECASSKIFDEFLDLEE